MSKSKVASKRSAAAAAVPAVKVAASPLTLFRESVLARLASDAGACCRVLHDRIKHALRCGSGICQHARAACGCDVFRHVRPVMADNTRDDPRCR